MASTTFSGPVTSTNGFIGNLTGAVTAAPVNATASTLTVDAATHAGRVVTLNRAGGIAVTLPAATGSGAVYTFIVGTTFTSSATIKVPDASTVFRGRCFTISDGAAAVLGYATAADSDTITFNGTGSGGYLGDHVIITDMAANVFGVLVLSASTGSEASPFSATV